MSRTKPAKPARTIVEEAATLKTAITYAHCLERAKNGRALPNKKRAQLVQQLVQAQEKLLHAVRLLEGRDDHLNVDAVLEAPVHSTFEEQTD